MKSFRFSIGFHYIDEKIYNITLSFIKKLVMMQGNILYRFPSLQRTASSQRSGRKEYVGRRWADFVGGVDKFFQEKRWQFRSFFMFAVADYVVNSSGI